MVRSGGGNCCGCRCRWQIDWLATLYRRQCRHGPGRRVMRAGKQRTVHVGSQNLAFICLSSLLLAAFLYSPLRSCTTKYSATSTRDCPHLLCLAGPSCSWSYSAAFIVHAAEIALYGVALYILSVPLGAGSLAANSGMDIWTYLYFSAETYTSLGFGDVTPVGPIRLLAGVEALNGLLLIGWSASFTYISMEQFWKPDLQQ